MYLVIILFTLNLLTLRQNNAAIVDTALTLALTNCQCCQKLAIIMGLGLLNTKHV